MDFWESLKAFLLAPGDDVQMKELEPYVAFRRLKNFACVRQRSKDILIWAKLDPETVSLEDGFTRDVSQIGHLGTGDLEIRINGRRPPARPTAIGAELSGRLTGFDAGRPLPP